VAQRRGRRGFKAVVAVLIAAVLVLLLLTPSVQSFLQDLITSPFEPRYPESATFTLERTLSVDANGGEVFSYDFDICEPSTIVQGGYTLQSVTSLEYSPQISFREERYGQSWVGWNGTGFSGNVVHSKKVTYEVTAYTHIWDIDRKKSGNISDIPASLKEQYLKNEWKMEVTSPAIVSASRSIVGDETNVRQVLRNIYDWMTVNVRYSTSSGGEPQTATETLESGVGDCDDQSILFCSLARAAGVPAWLQMGALYVSADDSWGGHGWLQAYLPLASGGGENVTIDVVNRDFLVFRPNRMVDFTDDGVAGHLTDYYYTFYTTFDPTSYSGGEGPVYGEDYEKISYVESSKKISAGGVYAAQLMPAGTALATTRR
jgi:hypothetical protein